MDRIQIINPDVSNNYNIVILMRNDHYPDQAQARQFTSNSPSILFASNQIKSTTTNALTFIPVNLFNQLKSMANIYFIIIAILQMVPSISVTGGTPTILFPLAFVMLAVLIKDAYEEFQRYQKDKKENQRTVEALENNAFPNKFWQQLRVGQIIKIRKQALIPCDCIVIKTSDPQNKCFVQTKGLDGQTNYKYKTSFLNNLSGNNLATNILKNNNCYTIPFQVNCGPPAPQINQFEGTIEQPRSKLKIPLEPTNLLLRGCTLKNVHEVIAICCYTGSDTKLVLNSAKFEPKKSKLMSQVDKIVIEVFIYQIIMALVCALFNLLLESSYKQVTQYIPSSNFWITTMTWWLLMTYFIPISLMVTMEMVKLFQGSVLARDKQGYSNNYKCFTSANNTSVNENLGQIKFVFTDKTGTLTKNNMIFRYLICNGQLFGEEEEKSSIPGGRKKPSIKRKDTIGMTNQYQNSVNFADPNFEKKKQQPKFQEALKVLCLCHEVSVQNENGELKYNSSSPDQVALINFAKLQGKEYLGEENKVIKIADYQLGGTRKKTEFQKLAVLQFNSDRKRMSVIVRDPATRKIQLLTKGADSTVKALLRPGQNELVDTQRHIDKLSDKGLRTLLLGKKQLAEAEFQSWYRELSEARGVIGEQKKKKISDCYQKIERNLELVGATAIEDELQDQVEDTIKTMRLNGMTFFILTGDKRQTAISIGRSCGLVDQNAKLVDIEEYTKENESQWRMNMLRQKQSKQQKIFLLNAEKTIPPDLPLQSTICYRCTPKNKEEIVRRVKSKTPYLTMAVGDGSNDVNMIKQASVGVGIKGVEGTQAARVADYVAGQFKFIKLLTLYHGREWYRKNCQLVNYSFFKNWFHVGSVIFYGGFSYFSGVVLYNVYLYELLNVVYSGWPIIIYALFDQQYTHKESYQIYDLYQPGINNQHFSHSAFLKTIGMGLLYGLIALLVVFQVLQAEVLDSTGKTGYLQLSGAVLFGVIIIIINLKILTMSTGVKPLNTIIVVLSIALYWVSEAFYGSLTSPKDLLILKQQWIFSPVIFVQIILIFFLVLVEFGYSKYHQFCKRYERAKQDKKTLEIELSVLNYVLK